MKTIHLCVLMIGSFQKMVASHLVEEEEVLSDHVAVLEHG